MPNLYFYPSNSFLGLGEPWVLAFIVGTNSAATGNPVAKQSELFITLV
jgi:hypothetical protein